MAARQTRRAPAQEPEEGTPAFTEVEDDVSKLDPKRGLVTKLAEVLGLISRLRKTGYNQAQKYRFATESDLTDMIRPMLARRHLFLFQSVIAHRRDEQYKTSGGNIMWLTTVLMSFEWHDGDTKEVIPAGTFLGYGADTGDKGSGKALTNAVKYALMKTFLVSTGDDPERDENTDRALAAREAAGGASGEQRVGPSHQQGVQRGGRSGIATQAQVTAIGQEAKRLGFQVADLHAFVEMSLGIKAPEDGPVLVSWLGELTAGQAGKLVGDLREMQRPESDEPGGQVADAEDPAAVENERDLLDEAHDALVADGRPEQTGMIDEYGV